MFEVWNSRIEKGYHECRVLVLCEPTKVQTTSPNDLKLFLSVAVSIRRDNQCLQLFPCYGAAMISSKARNKPAQFPHFLEHNTINSQGPNHVTANHLLPERLFEEQICYGTAFVDLVNLRNSPSSDKKTSTTGLK